MRTLERDCGGLNKNVPYRLMHLMLNHGEWNYLKG